MVLVSSTFIHTPRLATLFLYPLFSTISDLVEFLFSTTLIQKD